VHARAVEGGPAKRLGAVGALQHVGVVHKAWLFEGWCSGSCVVCGV
jgi:hypothetical protein